MSDTEQPLEFYFKADATGIVEIRHSPDPLYAIRVLLGLTKFIASNLRNRETGEPLDLAEFLRDLSQMVEQYEAPAVEQNPPN